MYPSFEFLPTLAFFVGALPKLTYLVLVWFSWNEFVCFGTGFLVPNMSVKAKLISKFSWGNFFCFVLFSFVWLQCLFWGLHSISQLDYKPFDTKHVTFDQKFAWNHGFINIFHFSFVLFGFSVAIIIVMRSLINFLAWVHTFWYQAFDYWTKICL